MTFEQALRSSGLIPREIEPDGKLRRCKTVDKPHHRNGAYRLYPDGTGWWRNWATESTPNHWRDESVARAATPADLRRMEAIRERERHQRRRAVEYARELWASGQPCRGHPYLTAKGLSLLGANGLRTWHGTVRSRDGDDITDTWLLVPMGWGGKLVNVQRISSKGVKRQIANAPQVGACFTLDRPGAALTCIVEGLATGLAVFQAVRHARVHVAFYADNLMPLTERLGMSGSVVFAADNDHKTKALRGMNPGIEKAKNAAEYIGAGVAYPTGIEGSDWADYLYETGEGAPKRIERQILAGAKFVMPRAPA